MLHEPYADIIGLTIGKLSIKKKCSIESYSVEVEKACKEIKTKVIGIHIVMCNSTN